MSLVQAQGCLAEADWTSVEHERDLIERAKRDRQAFAELYRQHYRALSNYVFRRTGDAHATEDLVADVFLIVLRTLPRYRYRGVPLRFWLLRIATNAVNRWVRRRARRDTEVLDTDGLPDPKANPAGADGQIDQERARIALLSLKPKHQAVLSLHYLEGLAVKEVSAVIGCRVGTVKSRLARARDALRQKLESRR